ncbi:hypothetical protein [Thermococcus sp.]
MRLILDSSAVIGLSRTGLLEKASENFDLAVSSAVYTEVAEVGYCRVGSHELRQLVEVGKVRILQPKDTKRANILIDPLGKGEAETIEIAGELGITGVLDDRVARRKAKQLGIRFIGTLRIIKMLFDKSVIDKEEALRAAQVLKNYGFRISDRVITKVFGEI